MLFLDSGDIEDVRRAWTMRIATGVTTNPRLLPVRDRSRLRERILEIVEASTGPVSVQVSATDADGMVDQAREYASWHDRLVVKIPSTAAGLEAMVRLGGGVPVNATGMVDPLQALLFARAGARFVSLFYSRMRDAGIDAETNLRMTRGLLERLPSPRARIIVGSIRCRDQVVRALSAGADIVTVPPKIIFAAMDHPVTERFVCEMTSQ